MAVPTFISAGSFANDVSGGASTAPAPPAHLVDDILLVVCLNAAGAAMSTTTTGWNLIFSNPQGGIRVAWFWKRATATTGEAPTITASSTDQFAICFVIRGCITTGTPYETTGTGVTSLTDTHPIAQGMTTAGADRLIMSFAGINAATSFSSGYPPASWNDRSNSLAGAGTNCRVTVMDIPEPTATTTSDTSFGTLGASVDWCALTLAWIPPVSAAFIPKKPFLVNQSINRASNY